jgi:hypothetical protein
VRSNVSLSWVGTWALESPRHDAKTEVSSSPPWIHDTTPVDPDCANGISVGICACEATHASSSALATRGVPSAPASRSASATAPVHATRRVQLVRRDGRDMSN